MQENIKPLSQIAFIDFISSIWVMNSCASTLVYAPLLRACPAQQTETNNNSLKYLCLQRLSKGVCVSVWVLCVCVFRSGTINFPALCTLHKRKGFSLFFPFACRLFPSLSLSALPQIHTVIKVVRYINQSLYHFVTGIQKKPLVFVV